MAKKYGLRKQLISGIHFNFSFKEELIEKLYENLDISEIESEEDSRISYKEFKNRLYLKISRNYIRYVWLIIYLTGCSVAAHDTFTPECTKLMENSDNRGGVYSERGPSFRNASCGYKNLEHLYPNYDSVDAFANDVQSFIAVFADGSGKYDTFCLQRDRCDLAGQRHTYSADDEAERCRKSGKVL